MGQPIEERDGHHGVTEYGEVGRELMSALRIATADNTGADRGLATLFSEVAGFPFLPPFA